jgi:hypothetical protein
LTQCEKKGHAIGNAIYGDSSWLPRLHSRDTVYGRVVKLVGLGLIEEDELETYSLTDIGRAYLSGFRNACFMRIDLKEIGAGLLSADSEAPRSSLFEGVRSMITITNDNPSGTIIVGGVIKVGGMRYQVSQIWSLQGSLISRPQNEGSAITPVAEKKTIVAVADSTEQTTANVVGDCGNTTQPTEGLSEEEKEKGIHSEVL